MKNLDSTSRDPSSGSDLMVIHFVISSHTIRDTLQLLLLQICLHNANVYCRLLILKYVVS